MSEPKTLKVKISKESKDVLYNICRYKEGGYPASQLLDASLLLKKIKEGTTTTKLKAKDQFGKEREVITYEGFTDKELDLTVEEFTIAKSQFNGVKGWNAETEAEIYKELSDQLK